MAGRKIGIDPGSMNLKLFLGNRNVVITEKDMIALGRKKTVTAAGNAAYEMFERTSNRVSISSPVCQGVITDAGQLTKVTEAVLKKNGISSGLISNFHFYIAVPGDVSEVEKRAYYNFIAHSAYSTRNIFMVEKAVAAAAGDGLPLSESAPFMLVDMGAGSTEISVLKGGGLVLSRMLREGGNTINDNIRRTVDEQHGLLIGWKTSEFMKFELGSAAPAGSASMTAYGRDRVSGLPRGEKISVELIFKAMREYFIHVMREVHAMLAAIPSEMVAPILDRGIYFTGGVCDIPGLRDLFASILGVQVHFSKTPSESAVRGLGKIMADPSAYSRVIFTLKDSAFE